MTSLGSESDGEQTPPKRSLPSAAYRPGPATLGVAIYGLLYLAWERTGWGSDTLRNVVSNVAFMPLNLSVAAILGRASRNDSLPSGTRQALALLALGSVFVFCGNVVSTYYVLALDANPQVSWADAFYLSDSALIFAALLSLPISRRTRLERWKFALDAAMVLISGGVGIWYFSVRPTMAAGIESLSVTLVTSAYPMVSLLVLLGVTTVLLRGALDPNRRALNLILSGLLLSVVADLTFDLVQLEEGGRTASVIDGVYLLFYMLLVAGGELYLRFPIPHVASAGEFRPRAQPLSPLPYFAVGTTYALLLYTALREWTDPVSGVAVGAACVTGLVVVRQLLAVRENVRLLAETALRQNEARFRALVQHSSDVIIVIRPDGSIRFVSPSARRVLRYEPSAVEGRSIADLLHGDDIENARVFIAETARTPGVGAPVEWRFRQPDGSALHAEIIATNLLDEPTVRGIVLNTRDVSERKRLEQQLVHQAFHDPLTGLANRALFRDRVSHALTLARRHGHALTVLFLDLDDFKKVNDSLGHEVGDRLLIAAAERFNSCSRVTDTVARFGGDEFAILLEERGAVDAAALVERLREAMEPPFLLGGNEVHVHASIGIATASGADTADDLLRNADVAMYAAKKSGKGRSEVYRSDMHAAVHERLELESALALAIERNELTLHYQPIVCLRTAQPRGVEALVRWNHPRHGCLLPQHFVPLAEETGLILRLGEWVLTEACRQIADWRQVFVGLDLTVAVNISGRQFLDPQIVNITRDALDASRLSPAALTLEITESVLMQQTEAMLERLEELRRLGVRLAIDDFGTGYSSLGYLRRFPLDMLKIAKPFVDDVSAGVERAALARAVVGLGETLGLRTVAEGVELAEQRASLTLLGCELGQGHLFAAPMPPDRLEGYLAQWKEPRRRGRRRAS
ncbi:MAG TPA: EAL domain-containing protein [Gemmatimonadales bacterium]|nr:EAL domain-containing protein [Gemmatimonadales bacterium]